MERGGHRTASGAATAKGCGARGAPRRGRRLPKCSARASASLRGERAYARACVRARAFVRARVLTRPCGKTRPPARNRPAPRQTRRGCAGTSRCCG
eukprot:23377-Prymnesium_polylepis.2